MASITNPVVKDSAIGILETSSDPAEFVGTLASRAVGLILVIGTLLFFFTLTIGAISWITSGGDKGASENAKNRISNSLVGLVILFSAFAVVLFIENFFGVNILTLDIGPLQIQ